MKRKIYDTASLNREMHEITEIMHTKLHRGDFWVELKYRENPGKRYKNAIENYNLKVKDDARKNHFVSSTSSESGPSGVSNGPDKNRALAKSRNRR